MNDYPGVFVTVEGIDGSGKSTVVRGIKQHFEETLFWKDDDWSHVPLAQTKEPSDTWTGEAVYKAISGDSDTPAISDFFMYMADRAHHVENIVKPALNDGELVLSDRYLDSTRAYQPQALEGELDDPKEFIEYTHFRTGDWCIEPDITLYLDTPIETAVERIAGDDKYEHYEFLQEVRYNYEELIAETPDRFVVLDGSQDADSVRRDAIREVSELALNLV